jgi:hypothetical protein
MVRTRYCSPISDKLVDQDLTLCSRGMDMAHIFLASSLPASTNAFRFYFVVQQEQEIALLVLDCPIVPFRCCPALPLLSFWHAVSLFSFDASCAWCLDGLIWEPWRLNSLTVLMQDIFVYGLLSELLCCVLLGVVSIEENL